MIITIVRTGTANLASVAAAFERLGARPVISEDPAAVATAARLVLPGVGAFGTVARGLAERGLAAPLRDRLEAGRPTLAVCLGLQLLASASDESPGAEGLGVLPATVRRLQAEVRVPHLGWNHVRAEPGCRLLEDGAAYFANSYALAEVPAGWCGAWFEHGGGHVAALERGAVLACQFHPELSDGWGAALLARWLEAAPC